MPNCCFPKQTSCCSSPVLAITTVPIQPWEEPYEPCQALKTGTIFPGLDLPFFITGGERHG